MIIEAPCHIRALDRLPDLLSAGLAGLPEPLVKGQGLPGIHLKMTGPQLLLPGYGPGSECGS